jgi:hypothetical protein
MEFCKGCNLTVICDVFHSPGALQSLLSTLQRAADWPEVEKQISKVISILVTYEDDWALLQRSALIILTALYTLQVKTLTQCKISAKAASDATLGDSDGDIEIANRSRTASCSSQVTVPSTTTPRWDGRQGMPMSPPLKTSRSDELRLAAASAGIAALGAPAGTAAGSGKRPGKYGETYYGHPTASLDSEVEELLHHQRDQAQVREKAEYMRRLLEEAEEEQENLKALISAAVAKLSLVLASEWGKLATPLGGFGSMGGGAGPGVGPGGAGGLGLGLGGTLQMTWCCCRWSPVHFIPFTTIDAPSARSTLLRSFLLQSLFSLSFYIQDCRTRASAETPSAVPA